MKSLLLLFLPILAHAQTDARWRLLPDSTVNMPFTDLRTVVAYRMASDDMRRSCVLEVVALGNENRNLREALTQEREAVKHSAAATTACMNDRDSIATDRDRWQGKAKRRGTVVAVLAAMLAAFTIATLAP